MTFAELKTELAARGFDYLSDTRQGYFVNRSYQEMAGAEDYPWLLSSVLTTNPVALASTLSDLRTIQTVIDQTTKVKLRPLDRRNITEIETDTTVIGSPEWYYVSASYLYVYPYNTTDTLAVNYWKVPADLSSDLDTPGFPSRFHHLIVDGATYYAYLDSDNFEAAGQTYSNWLAGRKAMDEQLLVVQHDQPDDYIVASNSTDG